MSRDIIIHYDAIGGKIVCCTVDATLTAALRAEAFPLQTPIDMFRSKDADEADDLLQKAVASGHTEAIEYLASQWPALRARSDTSFK